MQDAKMKVVACFSEAKEQYLRELMDAQTGVLKAKHPTLAAALPPVPEKVNAPEIVADYWKRLAERQAGLGALLLFSRLV